jgi:hypothetical protein
MRIGVAGSDGTVLCQLDAVREGMCSLGHEVVEWNDPTASFVFVGNPPFGPFLEAAHSKPFIFNVLDLARHCPEHEKIVSDLKTQLPKSARATVISETVSRQLKDLCDIEASVIYYPMKEVRSLESRPKSMIRVAMVGRTSDPNKRCATAVMALIRAGFNESEVAIIGPEYPGWGARYGTVSDATLAEMYQMVDYVMMLSKEEGIGLPAIEAACAGAIPIVLPDLSTYDEFWAASPMGPYYSTFTSTDSVARFLIHMENNPSERATIQAAMLQYANLYLRPKFDRVEVAKRILSVYHAI